MHVILIHLLVLTMYLFFWLVCICCIQYCSYDKYFVVKCIVHKVVLLLIAVTASPTVAKAKKKKKSFCALCPVSLYNCVTLSKAGRNKSADQFSFRAHLILSACSFITCHCQSVKQLFTTAVFTIQMNICWTSNSLEKKKREKIARVKLFMTAI